MGIFTNIKDKVKGKAVEKMMERQMKNLPADQREMMMKLIEDNPEFFENIAKEIEQEVKAGKSQMAAGMSVMRKHQAKLQQLMMNSMGGDPRMKDRNLR